MKSLSSLTEKEILDLVDCGQAEFRECEFRTPNYHIECRGVKCRNIDIGDIVVYAYPSNYPKGPFRVGSFNKYGGISLPIYNISRLVNGQHAVETTCSLHKLVILIDENDLEFYT